MYCWKDELQKQLCPGRSTFKNGGSVGGRGCGRRWAKGGGRRSLVMSCAERSGLEGLVISRGKSVPLGLGTLS